MIRIITFLTLLIAGQLVTKAQEKVNLTVEVTNIKSNEGSIFLALYNNEETFLKKNFKGKVTKIENNKASVVFKDIPKGTYAVSIFHDENNNKKMDTNFFGIPKEPYACSNDAKGFMGPPKYKDAKFNITENKTITLKF